MTPLIRCRPTDGPPPSSASITSRSPPIGSSPRHRRWTHSSRRAPLITTDYMLITTDYALEQASAT
jgi:hypothetical protein